MTTARNAVIQSAPGTGVQLGTINKGMKTVIVEESGDHYLIEIAGRKGYKES
ncbi:hypothetical protein [Neobacillus notoginsengisoli]|uniref:hypothetical protein n=1 Tax=Neobacillus notoginsengisoli TaxID=1578198 RepID=UPI001314C0DC|nr:hypothetical protein [Neobacillus notoginsengisoli]